MESVFISSTFKDMHMERDILNLNILPKLNSKLQTYGKSMQFSDLRWGIDTTGLSDIKSMRKILDVCESEIERCKPYIIVLLGDRYGTAISGPLISDNMNLSIIGKSVTHIEILKGVFQNYDRDRIFIYFRETEYSTVPAEKMYIYKESNPDSIQRLSELKERLKQEYSDRIKIYHANWDDEKESLLSDDFEKMIYENLYSCFEKEIKVESDSKPLYQKNVIDNHYDQIIESAYANSEKLCDIVNEIKNSSYTMVVKGESGAGKTVLISQLYRQMCDDQNVILFYFGINEYSMSLRNFVEYMLFTLCKSIKVEFLEDFENYSYSDLIEKLTLLKDELQEDIFIFADGLYHCDNVALFGQFLRWCQFYFEGHIKFICAIDDENTINEVIGRNYKVIECYYTSNDAYEIIQAILKENKKTINDEVINKIQNSYKNPLLTKLLITRLTMLKADDYAYIEKLGGGIEAINSYINRLIDESAKDESELLHELIDTVFDDYEKPQIMRILEYITISDSGIRESDLRVLFKKNGWNWSDLTYADMHAKLSYAFTRNTEGVINFAHYTLKEAFAPDNINDRMQDILALYYDCEKGDIWSETEFFKYVVMCNDYKKFINFIMEKCVGTDKDIYDCRRIAWKSVKQINEAGNSEFLFKSLKACENIVEKMHYLELIKSSLILSRDFQKRQTVRDNVYLMMALHGEVPDYPIEFLYIDYIECKKYLQRNNCLNLIKQVDIFYADKINLENKPTEKQQQTEYQTDDNEKQTEGDEEDLLALYMQLTVIQEASYQKRFSEVERAVKNILNKIENISENNINYKILTGDLYKELGNALKCQRKWDEAISCDKKYMDILSDLLSVESNEIIKESVKQKYRIGIYNIANSYEARALNENSDELWQETERLFEISYTEEIKAIACEQTDQNMLDAFSTTVSYTIALLKNGKYEQSKKIYLNGCKMIEDFSFTRKSDFLFVSIMAFEMEYLLQVIDADHLDQVDIFIKQITDYAICLMNFTDEETNEQLVQAIATLASKTTERLTGYFANKELDKAAILCKSYCKIARYFESIDDDLKLYMQQIIVCKNWADINYNALKDYEEADTACRELIKIIKRNNLLVKFIKAGLSEQLADFICTANARIINSLSRTGKTEEAYEYANDNKENIAYLAEFTNNFKNIPAYLVYAVARQIEDSNCRKLLADYAIEVAKNSKEAVEKNKEIIMMCSELL